GTSPVTCATCHNPNESDIQSAARTAWAESGHGEVTGLAWTPGSSHLWRNAGSTANFSSNIPATDCVRCHTSEGAAQFFTSKFTNVKAVASAADAATNSPLGCNACHIDNSFARLPVVSVAGTVYGDGKTPNS